MQEDFKDSVFMPELPDGLPMERDIEHRIDVKDPKVAMYRQQWRVSPEQKSEIDKWVRDMTSKGLIRPTFEAPSGLYEYLVLPMGVSNAPAMMHRLTSSLFKGLAHTRSFYDDIYIFTKSNDINKHLEALRDVLEILTKNRLYVKLSKCVFCASAIPCLGDFIGRNGIRIDPDKVQTIRDWPIPRTQEQLLSFLGFTGYVQRFCEQYAELTAPLFTLLKKKNQRNSTITLNADQLKNFMGLKRRLADTPVWHLPDFTKQMHLRTDASQFAVGGVLFQVVSGVERPIAFTTRKMKSAELKYPTQQQELLAIVNALAAFRIYCLDQPVVIETDHKSLEGVFQQNMANIRLARWYDILAEYQPVFAYLPGAKNGIADALSRRPDPKPKTKKFHDLLVPSFNETSYQLRVTEIRPTSDLTKTIIEGYKKDKNIQEIRRVIERRRDSSTTRGVSGKQYKAYFVENNLVWYQGSTDVKPRIVVPNIMSLKHKIIAEVHDSNYGGHPGSDRTYLKLQADWHWPRMIRTIKKYIADCEDCRQPNRDFRNPRIDGAFADSRRTVAFYFDGFYYGSPGYQERQQFYLGRSRLTDQAFALCPNSEDCVSSRTHQPYARRVSSLLRITSTWDEHLANAEFTINLAVNSSIKMFPFEADLGYVPANPLSALAASKRRRLRGGRQQGVKFGEHQAAVLRQCQEALEDAQAYMADVYDKGCKEQVFKIGDRVYLNTKNPDKVHTGFPNSRKVDSKWIGPYSVVRTVHKHAYELNLPPGLKLHPVFNTGSLKPYEQPSRLSRPQAVIVHNGSVGQLVEEVLKTRKRQGPWQYLIRWVGEEQATWEPLENLHQVSGLIQAFEAKQPKRSTKRRRENPNTNSISRKPQRPRRNNAIYMGSQIWVTSGTIKVPYQLI
ncbi:unnamed protein product [Phytophthora fragariaefolia]|uniref:Unnamed protein product n=1 Tax=Phytophthora fragariaefolia TaxID=1490495 RepID=A0A9W6UFA7_9STRA|nr:unnamed protein product [Phytophthora fragariaefolia]